eukprot:TRINITY_DN4215_c0_g1_i1.p1 TRINITY_DN4215_c0_g1~~TRINITY_DN4215_c0_g1_i1.p1  ORF type:complete len:418 (-),score=149.62 TRINITY_DN4215_c0_g1_i1:197-1450(-)
MPQWKTIKASEASLRIKNPIRDIVDSLKVPPNPPKPLISLSIGDPTVFGNLPTAENVAEKMIENIRSGKYNGYSHSAGYESARMAIAKKHSDSENKLEASDVFLASGCSGALEIVVSVLATEGQNILLPSPGFSLYTLDCELKGIEPRYYRCLPNRNWEIDLDHLSSLVDENTAAILVNNPSNPTGSVFSKEHLLEIIKVADKHCLPIIADEIYEGIIFEGNQFHSLGNLSKTVPVLSVGGLAKNFLVPGWRLGWIIVHDKNDLFSEVRKGLLKLTQILLGPSTLSQSIVEEALCNTPQSYSQKLTSTLQKHSQYLSDQINRIPGLEAIQPGGAMYLMFGIDFEQLNGIKDDVEFSQKLLEEEVLLVLPGKVFQAPGFVRLVTCPPMDKLTEACDRLSLFMQRHSKADICQTIPKTH